MADIALKVERRSILMGNFHELKIVARSEIEDPVALSESQDVRVAPPGTSTSSAGRRRCLDDAPSHADRLCHQQQEQPRRRRSFFLRW